MPDWMLAAIPPTIAVALITTIGTLVGVAMNRQTARETNDINKADTLIKNLSTRVDKQNERLDQLDIRIQEQGQQIRDLQISEWGLKRYVHKLIDFIRSIGQEPPDPPHGLTI